MIKNHIKIGIRSLRKQGAFTVINIVGLSMSLAFALLMGMWIHHEMSFDKFHESGDRIYELIMADTQKSGDVRTFRSSSFPLAQAIAEEIPEVKGVANFGSSRPRLITYKEKNFRDRGLDAMPSFFEVFSFPLITGTPATIFEQSNSMVLSESFAEKIFGKYWETTALGQTLQLENDRAYLVTGIFQDVPETSSLQFDFVFNRINTINDQPDQLKWDMLYSTTYVKLREGVAVNEVEQKITAIEQSKGTWAWGEMSGSLFPIHDTHLYAFENGKPVPTRLKTVRTLLLAVIFLLMIACINFINLSTARSSLRAKEVGVRKVVGAGQRNLIQQFLTESALITIAAVVLAVLMAEILSPFASNLTGKTLDLNLTSPELIGSLLFGTVAIILLSGAYPAFALSNFKVNHVLRDKLSLNTSSAGLRKGLVVFQFVLSGLLIISALTVQLQVHYLKNKELGLNREHVVIQQVPRGIGNFEQYKNTLENTPGIAQVSISNNNPLMQYNSTFGLSWPGKDPDARIGFGQIQTDENYIDLMGLELLAGRSISDELKSDSASLVINEAAARIMGFDNPVGQRVNWGDYSLEIVGLIKDYHFRPLHYEIDPLVLLKSGNYNPNYLVVKTEASNLETTLNNWNAVHKTFAEDYPFNYEFLDDSFNQLYDSETLTGKLTNYFAFMALFVSCLGLLGLSAFAASRRSKEISIRKVLGASVTSIVGLLSKDFLKLIVVALVIAMPLAYYFMQGWLEDFAYHIKMDWWIFIAAAAFMILIAFLTMSWQSAKAAWVNPAVTLKSE